MKENLTSPSSSRPKKQSDRTHHTKRRSKKNYSDMLNKQLKLLVGRPSSHEIPQGDGTTGFVGAPADFVMLLEIQKFQIKQR